MFKGFGADLSLITALIGRTLRLLGTWGPMMLALWLAGDLAQAGLRDLAVIVGAVSGLGGLAVVTLTILVRLVVIVALFRLIDPARRAAIHPAPGFAHSTGPGAVGFATDISLVLVPFFLYYTAWGFLNDALRSYAMLSMDADPIFARGPVMAFDARWGSAVWVALAWLLRRFAKAQQARSRLWLWPMLVVTAEAMWVFLGVYVISRWQGDLRDWLAHLPAPADLWRGLVSAADAAPADPAGSVPPPSDRVMPTPRARFWSLFYYALLPVVWFNLAAIIRGHDVAGLTPPKPAQAVAARWSALPKGLRDFAGHFFMGVVKRWNAVANGLRMMSQAGFTLMVATVVAFRLIDLAAGWGFFALTGMLGPMDLGMARVVQVGAEILFGPARQPGMGLLPEVAKICLLGAALDLIATRQRDVSMAASPQTETPARTEDVTAAG